MGLTDWLPTIGSVVGTAADIWSQNSANNQNAQNVQKQIDFQREQGTTQWQRAVEDMKKAGLNPALAYEKGGNSTSAGSAATVQPISQNSGSKLANAADAYTAFANGVAQRDLLRAQATATGIAASVDNMRLQQGIPETILAQDPEYAKKYREQRFADLAAKTFTAGKTPEQFHANLANLGAGTAKAQAEAANARASTTLIEQQFQNEWFRKNISPYINSTSKAVGLFGDVKDLINPYHFGHQELAPPYEPPDYTETQEFYKGGATKTRSYHK